MYMYMYVGDPADVLNTFKPTTNSARKLVRKVFMEGCQKSTAKRDARVADGIKSRGKVLLMVSGSTTAELCKYLMYTLWWLHLD